MLYIIRMILMAIHFVFAGIINLILCVFRPFNPDNSRLVARVYSLPAIKILGLTVQTKTEDLKSMPQDVVYVANHQSNFDLFIVGSIVPKRTVTIGKDVLKWVVEHFGGQISVKKNWNTKWKQRYDWTLTGYNSMEKFILAILPYLIIKRQQAFVALEFARLNGQEVPEKRNELRNKMLILNNSSQPHSESLTTNTSGTELHDSVKRESDLVGDNKSTTMVT